MSISLRSRRFRHRHQSTRVFLSSAFFEASVRAARFGPRGPLRGKGGLLRYTKTRGPPSSSTVLGSGVRNQPASASITSSCSCSENRDGVTQETSLSGERNSRKTRRRFAVMSSSVSTMASSTASASASAAASTTAPPAYKIVGICLAVGSGLLIGASESRSPPWFGVGGPCG